MLRNSNQTKQLKNEVIDMFAEDKTQRDARSRINLHELNLEGLAEDPADPKNGDIWRIETAMVHELRCYINDAVEVFKFV